MRLNTNRNDYGNHGVFFLRIVRVQLVLKPTFEKEKALKRAIEEHFEVIAYVSDRR